MSDPDFTPIQNGDRINRPAVPTQDDPPIASPEDAKNHVVVVGEEEYFERRFGLWTAVGIGFCASSAWEAIAATLLQALAHGGPLSLVWGYLLTAVGALSVAASLAELSSMWPSAGAQYYWTAELTSKRWRPLLSYAVAWLNFATLLLAVIGMTFGLSTQVQASIVLCAPNYVLHRWHTALIFFAFVTFYMCMNIFFVKAFHSINVAALIVHITMLTATIITMTVTTSPKHTAKYVFTEWDNSSGWSSSFVAFCIGIQTSSSGFAALHTPCAFAEEMRDASKKCPQSHTLVNAVLTFPWVIAILFCLGDLPSILATPTGQLAPIIQIYYNGTGSKAAAVFMTLFTGIVAMSGGIDLLGSCARAIYAAARDQAFPSFLAKIDTRFNVPIWPLVLSTVLMYLIGMIYIWNTTAYYAFISSIMLLQMISYAIPIGLALWRGNKGVKFGPWNLGRLFYPVHCLSLSWCIFIITFSAFPASMPISPANMNYASVLLGGTLFLAAVVYFSYSRGKFYGPRFQIMGLQPVVETVTTNGQTVDTYTIDYILQKQAV